MTIIELLNSPLVAGAANVAQFKNLNNTDILLRLDRQDYEYLRKIYEQNNEILNFMRNLCTKNITNG